MRRSFVSACLAEVTQQIHSLRASGVMSAQSALTFASAPIALRKSAGIPCTTPPAIVGWVIRPMVSPIFAEAERFELSVGCPTHAFQACALDRYATPPAFRTLSRVRALSLYHRSAVLHLIHLSVSSMEKLACSIVRPYLGKSGTQISLLLAHNKRRIIRQACHTCEFIA